MMFHYNTVTHLILRFAIVQNKFQQTNKTKINHINDNHIKFEFFYILGESGLLCAAAFVCMALLAVTGVTAFTHTGGRHWRPRTSSVTRPRRYTHTLGRAYALASAILT